MQLQILNTRTERIWKEVDMAYFNRKFGHWRGGIEESYESLSPDSR